MIGLIDYDISTSTSQRVLIPNLEIMKLATYYKIEENMFCRLLNLTDTELEGYDIIYFFSETSPNPIIPPAFLGARNVVFGGSSFTQGIYQPFDNVIIDYTIPKPSIYKNFLKDKYDAGVKTKVIEHVLDDTYYRVFLNNKQLPIPPIHYNKRVFIYDTDIFKSGWQDVIKNIIDHKPSGVFFVHPIICKTLTNFVEIRSYKKIARTNTIVLDLNIPLSEVYYLLKKYQTLFQADISKSTAVAIFLGGSYATSFQYYKDFVYKINLLYSFWAKGIELKIKYDYPKIGYKNPLETLEQMIESWANTDSKYKRTLDDKITKYLTKDIIAVLQQEKELLLKFQPAAKDLFYQNFTILQRGGYWRI